MKQNTLDFLNLAYQHHVLSFGDFTLKSGRKSPYFFNAGQFSDSAALSTLGQCYANALVESGIQFDGLFGPAYKGIPLATATSIAWQNKGHPTIKVTFDRKEEKDHGEGGHLIGAPLNGRIILVDDVISAGTAARQAIDMISHQGGTVEALLVGLDRQERGQGTLSASQELAQQYDLQVVSIAKLEDLMDFVKQDNTLIQYSGRIKNYRDQYGV